MPRIYQLAKELNINYKSLLQTARKIGIRVSSHLSAISDGEAMHLLRMVKVEQRSDVAPQIAVAEAPAPEPAKINPTPKPAEESKSRRGRKKFVVAEPKKTPKAKKATKEAEAKAPPAKITSAKIVMPITVKELCGAFGAKSDQVITVLMRQGSMRRINDFLDKDEIESLAIEFDIEVEFKEAQDRFAAAEALALAECDVDAPTQPRPPVVTLLGHVDHGKTTLLDKIRDSDVAAKEAGGITQHIGAFSTLVEGPNGSHQVVFLDTPGHEAFSAMRARGAQVTDIVVLVVAADDGVMPTTREAIEHAQAANVPIVVALTKTDKPNANPLRVKGELAAIGLAPTGDWGGTTEVVEVSAYKGTGIEDLLLTLALEADLLELTSTPSHPAKGIVLEASKDALKGVTATFLIQDGTLRPKDTILAGHTFGSIRRMEDSHGQEVSEAGASMPVKVFGLSEVPQAGDAFQATLYIAATQQLANEMKRADKLKLLAAKHSQKRSKTIMDAITSAKETKEASFIIKADAQGSVEVITGRIPTLANEEISVAIHRAAVGPITEADVQLAASTGSKIIGFHVTPNEAATKAARVHRVEIHTYRLIHDLLDSVYKLLEGELGTEEVEVVVGKAEIKKLFTVNKSVRVAGCRVAQGIAARNAYVRIYREGIEIASNQEHGYKVASLKDHKNDAKEIKEGHECGLSLDGFGDFKEGDMLEFVRLSQKARVFSAP